jgi:2-hydroxyglutarate dehydrogenase
METPPERCDVVVVGAGIVGLSVARALAERDPGLEVAVIEREPRLGAHQTSHNSGVVHAGIYYRPRSLKAELCVAGARELRAYCERRDIALREVGKVIVALNDCELAGLEQLETRAHSNGVPGVRRIGVGELRELEPAVIGIGALHSPHTAVVDFAAVAHAYAADTEAAGGSVTLGCPVEELADKAGVVVVRHAHGETVASHAIVCAGAWAGRLAPRSDPDAPRLVQFRGAYKQLRPERADLINGLVYPVPDPTLPFLGMHFTRTVDDRVLVGPTALMVGAPDAYKPSRIAPREARRALAWPGTWRMGRRWWRTGLRELSIAANGRAFLADARRYLPALTAADLVAAEAGVRAQPVARDGTLIDDFLLTAQGRVLHVASAPSPAATSSLPLGRLIVKRAQNALALAAPSARTQTHPDD